jgi:hypothetical protein
VAQATFYEERGQGAVVMVNSNEGAPLLDEVVRAIAKEYGWPGYFDAEAVPATVTRREGGPRLAADGQPPLELWAVSEERVVARVLNADVTFEKAEKGPRLRLQQGGRETVADKVARETRATGAAGDRGR